MVDQWNHFQALKLTSRHAKKNRILRGNISLLAGLAKYKKRANQYPSPPQKEKNILYLKQKVRKVKQLQKLGKEALTSLPRDVGRQAITHFEFENHLSYYEAGS